VNLGRHIRYPYTIVTHLAKARATSTHWWRETFCLTVSDAYELVLFVYLHELYHYLVKAAGKNPRRKEAMCDRFAARRLVEHHGCRVHRRSGQAVPVPAWDFKDLDAFVAAAPQAPAARAERPIPVRIRGLALGG